MAAVSFAESLNAIVRSKVLSFGSHLSISVTQRCPLRCDHCIVESGPSHTKSSDLPAYAVEKVVVGIGEVQSIRQISLTGGEPFLRTDIIHAISEAAYKRGAKCGAVTSGSWASNKAKAVRTLRSLPYLDHVTISCDIYHAKYLPIANVKNAFEACREEGRTVSVRVSIAPHPDDAAKRHLAEVRSLFGDRVHTQELVEFGRASNLGFAQHWSSQTPVLPCLSSGPHVTNTGRVLPCCSTLTEHTLSPNNPLVLGDLQHQSLEEVMGAAQLNYLLTQIRLWGFGDIVEHLRTTQEAKQCPSRFIKESQCSLCATLMTDPKVVDALASWIGDVNIRAQIASGKFVVLGEDDLLEHFRERDVSHLNGSGSSEQAINAS